MDGTLRWREHAAVDSRSDGAVIDAFPRRQCPGGSKLGRGSDWTRTGTCPPSQSSQRSHKGTNIWANSSPMVPDGR